MRLAPRVARLERRHGLRAPNGCHPEMVRLQEEARAHAGMRQATRQLAASMWERAAQRERAAAVRGGHGWLADEVGEAVAALGAETRARYARAVRRLIAEATARRPC